MRNLSTALAIAFAMATAASADVWLIAPDSTITDTTGCATRDTTKCNAKVKAISGATTYQGKASTSNVQLTGGADTAWKFTWNVVPNATLDGAYGTTAGLLIPPHPDWSPANLAAGDTIQFQIKGVTAKDTESVNLIIGSDLYLPTSAAANAALTSKSFKLTSTWTTVKIATKALVLPSWFTSDAVRDPNSDELVTFWNSATPVSTEVYIGTAVTNLNFQPQNLITWTNSGATGATTANSTGSFEVRDIRIAHAITNPNTPNGATCTGPSFVLDDFSASATVTANKVGGYWFAFSDSDTTVAQTDSAKGNTHIILPTGKTEWAPDRTLGVAAIRATLEKNDVGSPFTWHPYAGWVDIGTSFADQVAGVDLADLASSHALTGISFDFYTGPSLLGTGFDIDTVKVPNIIFKASKASVGDAQPFQISLADRQGNGNNFCVDVNALAQPAWYTKKNGVTAFQANDLTQLAWEAIIADQKQPSIHTAPAAFGIANVKLWGVDATDFTTAIRAKTGHASQLKATYGSSLVLSFQVAGASAQVDVLRLDGSKVASFKTAPVANGLSLPVSLTHGTYLVSVRGDATRLVRSISVAR